MALSNPFAADGSFKSEELASGQITVEDSESKDTAKQLEAAAASARTINAFLDATHEFLLYVKDWFYDRRIKNKKEPDERPKDALKSFEEKFVGTDESTRQSFGEIAIRQYHDAMNSYYDDIAAYKMDVILDIENEELKKSGFIDLWASQHKKPKFRNKCMKMLAKMNDIAEKFYLGIAISDVVPESTMNNTMKVASKIAHKLKDIVPMLTEDLTDEDMAALSNVVKNPSLMSGAFSQIRNSGLDLGSMLKQVTGALGGAGANVGAGGGGDASSSSSSSSSSS